MYRTKIERPFLAAKGFITNLVQIVPKYRAITSNVHTCSFTCTISHMQDMHLKQFFIFHFSHFSLARKIIINGGPMHPESHIFIWY